MAVRDKYLSSTSLVYDLNDRIMKENAEVECENIR